ncbi:uncharacterized protein TrAtP1_006578 [Trichoderma atroviride]|nr:hypothetical protein TrAtP1_006578 [Trichoderma atroviride]
MREIYGTASEVIIFLGDGSHADYNSPLRSKPPPGPCRMFGIDDMNIPLARQTLDNWKMSALKGPVQALEIFSFLAILTQFRDSSSLLESFKTFPKGHVTALFEALRRTLLVAWWDRIWVVQEAVVAQTITVRYSGVAASWEFLVEVTRSLSRWDFAFTRYPNSISADCLKVFNLFSRISDLDHHRKDWKSMQRTDLLTLLRSFGHRKATDNRDRVYALLGLCSDVVAIRPNYLLNEAEVYTAAVLAIIRSTRSLSIMCGDYSRKASQDLPSWVPDWGTILVESDRQRAKIFNFYDACQGVIPIIDSPEFRTFLRHFKDASDPKQYLRKEAALELQKAYKMSFREPEIQSICASLMKYCNGQSRQDLPRYSLIRNSGRSLVAKCIKIGTVTGITEPLYSCSDMNSAAKVIHGWAQVHKDKYTTNYVNGDFLVTIMSGAKKAPDGSLERLIPSDMPALDAWYCENIEQRSLGKDRQEFVEPLDTKYDIFTEALRLSATKRTMFFLNYNGPAVDALVTDCFISLEAQQKTLLNGASFLAEDLFTEGVELLKDDQLFKLVQSITAMHRSTFNEKYFDKYADLVSKRKAIFQKVQQHNFSLSNECQKPCEEYLDAYKDFISQRDMLERFIIEAYFCTPPKYGHLGLGPLLMKEGDEIYILPGSRSPLVLRPISSQTYSRAQPQAYQLVGDCFINGAMDGDSATVGDNIVDYIESLDPDSENHGSCFRIGAGQSGTATGAGRIVTLEIV